MGNRKFTITVVLLLIVTALYSDGRAYPDTLRHTTTRNRRFNLEEIKVIATTPSESAGRISIIHLEDTKRQEELNLAGLLQNISGVNVTTGSRGESNLRIRGFRRENVRIMVDGRQVTGGYFGNVSLNEIPAFAIEEIHVVKGAVSALYGTNSSGGVVNFVSRRPDNQSWLTVRTSIQRNDTQSLQVITAHSFDLWDYWLNVSGFRTNGFVLSRDFQPTPFESGSVRNSSQNRSIDIQSRVNFTLFDIHSLGFSFGYTYTDVRNVPPSIFEPTYRKFFDWRRYSFTGLGTIHAGPWLTIKPTIYYDAFDNTYQEFMDASFSRMTLDSILESWTFGAQVRSEYIFSDRNKVYHLYRYERQAYNRKDNRDYPDWTTNFTNLHNTSFMLNHKFSHLWQTSLSLGMSQSQRTFRETSLAERSAINTKLYIEPALSVHYDDLINSWDFAISRNIQYPTMRQLYSLSRGNMQLLPERVIKTEVNYGRNIFYPVGVAKVQNSVFFNYIEGMIDRVNSLRFYNQKNVMNAGFEVAVVNRLFDMFETEHQLAYINLQMNEGYDFHEIPAWTSDNTLSADITKSVRLSYSVNWSDKVLSSDSSGRLHQLPARVLHSTGVSFRRDSYRLAFSVSNLFDLDYQEEWGYPAAGRNFSLSLEWTLF